MPTASPSQPSFAGGEWGPLLYGRADLQKFRVSCKTILNYIPLPQGPAVRRSGTRFVAPLKKQSKSARLLPFEFSVTQAYMIEFGDLYFRFYRNRAPIAEADVVITGITQANPGVVTTSAAHGYTNGDEVIIEDVVGMVEVNTNRYIVANKTASTFELTGTNTTAFTAYASAGVAKKIYELSHPYLEADIPQVRKVQSNDVLYLVHPSYTPRKLERTGHTSWTLTEIAFQDGPYLPSNTTATTLALSATSGSVTVTASAVTGINNGQGFLTTDVGRLIRYRDLISTAWGWLKITAHTDTTHVTATVEKAPAAATASAEWRLGVWSDTTGYPAAVTFYEDRLVFGGPTANLNRLDGSSTGDYENFQPDDQSGSSTVLADNAVAFTLTSRKVNAIRWMIEDDKGLFVGTTGGEWIIKASNSEAISAINPPRAKRSTTFGVAEVHPVEAGNAILYLSRDKKRVRELAYVFEDDGFRAPEMTLLADQITKHSITEIAYQQSPHSIMWAALNNGTLAGFSYERDQDVTAWHRHILGGQSDAAGTQTKVESVEVIPSSDETMDEAWVIAQRWINGATARYIEFIEDEWEDGNALADAFFVDSGLTYDGAATTTIRGLDHLEGETVSILCDGITHPDQVVASGKITLENGGAKVHVGLHKNAFLTPLSIEAGSREGSPQGKTKRIDKLLIRVLASWGGHAGKSDATADLDPVPGLEFFDDATDYDAAPDLVTGWVEQDFDGEYNREVNATFAMLHPLPSIVQAMAFQLSTQDD